MTGKPWLLVLAVVLTTGKAVAQTTSYEVDLLDRADDRFKVVVQLTGLGPADSIFQFAATAPGTYQIEDIGRYVENLRAFDANGREIPVARVSTNRWRFSDPARVRTVRYAIAETWDTPVPEHTPYLMCGTSIEADNVLVSPHAVFGYPALRQGQPVRVRFERPARLEGGVRARPRRAGVVPRGRLRPAGGLPLPHGEHAHRGDALGG